MPVYEYRCAQCELLEMRYPIGSAPEAEKCPTCGKEARRVFSSPYLNHMPRPVKAVLDRAHKSAYEPEVIKRETSEENRKQKRATVSADTKKLVGEKAWKELREARHPAAPAR